ncbi:MAG: hypothetical protein KAI47_00125 [Deltaproteobacteria bacterium]|nr:hypothetical protein [Deltaproteobacteria bacterium]
MPYELALPLSTKRAGWKVKILDKERLEPPHVTILFRSKAWRLSLRDKVFLYPPGGSWKDVPSELRRAIADNWKTLVRTWDTMYPQNPVMGTDDDGGQR